MEAIGSHKDTEQRGDACVCACVCLTCSSVLVDPLLLHLHLLLLGYVCVWGVYWW